MAKFDCSFCSKKIYVQDISKLPDGWGIIIGEQGKCRIEFVNCPEHKIYERLTLWDLIAKEKITAPSKESPHPFGVR